jgi:hypothetical protein
MYGKERVNDRRKYLLGTAFVQNDQEKSILSIYHPGKNKGPLGFAVLADVVSNSGAGHNSDILFLFWLQHQDVAA